MLETRLEGYTNIMWEKKKDNIDIICKQTVKAYFFSKINVYDMLN